MAGYREVKPLRKEPRSMLYEKDKIRKSDDGVHKSETGRLKRYSEVRRSTATALKTSAKSAGSGGSDTSSLEMPPDYKAPQLVVDPRYMVLLDDPRYKHLVDDPKYKHLVDDPKYKHLVDDPRYKQLINDPKYKHLSPRYDKVGPTDSGGPWKDRYKHHPADKDAAWWQQHGSPNGHAHGGGGQRVQWKHRQAEESASDYSDMKAQRSASSRRCSRKTILVIVILIIFILIAAIVIVVVVAMAVGNKKKR